MCEGMLLIKDIGLGKCLIRLKLDSSILIDIALERIPLA